MNVSTTPGAVPAAIGVGGVGHRFEVMRIDGEGEILVAAYDDQAHAFEGCLDRWGSRRTGGPVFAVRDTETEQRWSYRDIQDLREQQLEELRRDEQRREDNRRWERENAK